MFLFFFKQNTAYEMRISDWSSDVCSSDLLSFQAVIGAIFRPVMWLMGVPWDESAAVGGLFGTKVVLNEFVAFIDLGKEQAGFAPISVAIATFALCGFANFSSIAIQMAVTGEIGRAHV